MRNTYQITKTLILFVLLSLSLFFNTSIFASTTDVSNDLNSNDIIISMIPVNGVCGSKASVRTSVVGGTAPYEYKWSNDSTESSIEDVEAGYYIVTVTDQTGCTATNFAEVTKDENQVSFDLTVFPSTCHGADDGSVDIEVTEGLEPFIYYINGEIYEGDFTNLLPGSYSIVVVDANGCSDATVLQLNEPDPISVEIFENGTIDINVIANDGFPPYDYQWSNGTTGTQLTNVSPNDYVVTITDQNGCVTIQVVSVTVPLTSVETIESLVDMNVYPNPCSVECVLDVTFEQYEETEITLFSMNGVAIQQFSHQGNQFQQTIPVETLESGLYLVQIRVGNAVNHEKLMVMR